MPHYKCTGCHHEFDRIPDQPLTQLCDWCGAPAFILEEKTPFEKLANDIKKSGGFEKWLEKGRKEWRYGRKIK